MNIESWIVIATSGVAGIYFAPVLVSAIGFKAAGIAAGTYAPGIMSAMAVNGATTAGGVVATLQSIGATGTVLGSILATGTASIAGSAVGAIARGLKLFPW